MIRSLLRRLSELVTGRTETVLDFLGVRAIDIEQGILVLPDHIVAVVDLGGTDYAYSSYTEQHAIADAWKALLNNSRMSVQLFYDRRPLKWDLPGGYLDIIDRQVPTDSADPWYRERFAKHRDAILRGELGTAYEVRQLAIVRFAAGEATRREVKGESFAYQPPPEPWRVWEKVRYRFAGADGLRTWRKERRRLIAALEKELRKFFNDVRAVPGMTPRRLVGAELVQLLHLLWRDDEAYDEWIADDDALAKLLNEDHDGVLEHPGPLPEMELNNEPA